MARIIRQPEAAAEDEYDLIVIGGGIYGACATYEAATRGKRALLIERDDFGGATSLNSLRILHGGLRYLQSLDFKRFRESVDQRQWFTRKFPQYVQPLKCLMPLYGDGLRRPSIFRMALAMNDFLSRGRNRNIPAEKHLPASRVINAAQTTALFAKVDRDQLRGGAVWHDMFMLNPQRMLIELLHAACDHDARALNYVRGENLVIEQGRARGVEAVDQVSGELVKFRGRAILNCAGPWCRALAATFDRDIESLYRPSIAFNLLIDKPALGDAAVAVAPKAPGARTYFAVPFRGRIFAGTFHAPWAGPLDSPQPTDEQIQAFIDDLNKAIPDFHAGRDDVRRVFAGFMPTLPDSDREPAHRPVFIDHGKADGPAGAFTISGVKWTTAQREARGAIDKIFGPNRHTSGDIAPIPTAPRREQLDLTEPPAPEQLADEPLADELRQLFHEESAVHLDDFFLRRTDWGAFPADAIKLAPKVARILNVEHSCAGDDLNHLKSALST